MCLSAATNFFDKIFSCADVNVSRIVSSENVSGEGAGGIPCSQLLFQVDCRLRGALYHLWAHTLKAWILLQPVDL